MVANRLNNRMDDLSGEGSVYHRVSTDTQDAERQRATTKAWLIKNGVVVKPEYVFEDQGWSRGDADRRPAFQRMLTLADKGRINWCVIDRQDRAESYDKYETAANIHRLRLAGCRLYTVDGRELTAGDIMSFIQTGMSSEQSELEVREKSVRTLEGKRILAKRGEWMGGRVPYGMDVVAFRLDTTGDLVEQWRVQIVNRQLRVKITCDGSRRDYEGKHNFPASEQDEILQLRPTVNQAKLAVVKHNFYTYATERTTAGTIARQLNERGTEPPAYSRQWSVGHIQDMLDNPVWIGHPTWNRHTSSKYFSLEDGERQPKKRGSKPKRHDRKDWVMPDAPLYPAVIDRQTWDKVQAKLANRKVIPRASRSSGYVFSGLVVCGNCGGTMTGSKMPTKGGKPKPLTYLCGTYNKHKGSRKSCPCKAYRVLQSMVEDALRNYLGETCPIVADINVAAISQKPEALKLAIKRAVDAYDKMLLFCKAKVVSLPDDSGNERTFVMLHSDDLITEERLENFYRRSFDDEKVDWENEQDKLLAEQDKLIDKLGKIPATSTSALARIQEQIDEVDAKIRKVDANLVNAADEFAEAEAEYSQLDRNWQAAQEALETHSSDRRRAEVIRQVVSRIVVTFRPTGRTCPVGVVEWIEVIPLTQGFSGNGSMMPST